MLFSVEFEHNGIFIGQGVNRSYIGSTYLMFDYCHAGIWSLENLKYCLDKLDYAYGFQLIVFQEMLVMEFPMCSLGPTRTLWTS